MATVAHGAAAIFQSTIGRSQSVYFRVGRHVAMFGAGALFRPRTRHLATPTGLVRQTGRPNVQTRAPKHRPSRPTAVRCVTPSVNAMTSQHRWHWSSRRPSKSDVIKCVTTGRRRGAVVAAFQATFGGRLAPSNKRRQTANGGPSRRTSTTVEIAPMQNPTAT